MFPAALRRPRILLIISLVLVAIFSGGVTVWAGRYEGKIAPGVSIGDHVFDGQDPETARQWIQSKVDALTTQGIDVNTGTSRARVALSQLVGGDTIDAVAFDVDAVVQTLSTTHHAENKWSDVLAVLIGALKETHVRIPVTLYPGTIQQAVYDAFPAAEQPATNPSFVFTQSTGQWQATVTPGTDGVAFAFDPFLVQLTKQLETLSSDPLSISLVTGQPTVSDTQAENQVDLALAALQAAPLVMMGTNVDGKEQTWKLEASDLKNFLAPGVDGLLVDDAAFTAFVDLIAPEIEVAPQNARFTIENGRAQEFALSKEGISIDRPVFQKTVVDVLRAGTMSVVIPTIVAEPTVTTAEGNDLGIEGVLGVGISKFKGSPTNRIKNIKNGVSLLNGLLVAPDETFSLLNALKPFEVSHGYFPELVIKGDKIEPEVGGGLCQIGTTTFRAAMMSGLPIVSRSNHSLVVSYYNDLSNGNPGTDATIYDPAPDFQFKNDTGHYILFQAEIFEDTQELHFTFWGTSDGRKASYTPPEVIRWIGVGETRMTETDTLEPGVKKCQSAHVGADTTFTYSIVRPNGTQEDVIFDSHYRPLPEICLVGAAAPTETTTEATTGAEITPETTVTEEPTPVVETPASDAE